MTCTRCGAPMKTLAFITELLTLSCKQRGVCPSCDAKRAAAFAAFLKDELLENVGHSLWTFTLPKMLRPYFMHHRELLGDLARLAYETIKELMLEAVGDEKARPGVVAVPQTFGSALNVYRSKKLPNGRTKRELVPRENWHAFLPDAHPGYISWGEFERIEQLLRESAKAYGADRRHGPPREGPALLQGRAICGLCGGCRMAVHYHRRGDKLVPDYQCMTRTAPSAPSPSQVIPGASIDAAIGKLAVEAMTPMALEVALAVWQES